MKLISQAGATNDGKVELPCHGFIQPVHAKRLFGAYSLTAACHQWWTEMFGFTLVERSCHPSVFTLTETSYMMCTIIVCNISSCICKDFQNINIKW